MKGWLKRHWFLVSLVLVVLSGFSGWGPLQQASTWRWLQNSIVFGVMFLMALPIEARAFGRTIRRPWAPVLAIAISYLFQPLASWPLAQLLPTELGNGLMVAAIVPCTLASAAVWTRRAEGNDAVALVVTVVTNGGCFLIAPLWLWLLLGQGESDPGRWLALVPKLGLLVVAPMALAQLCRGSARIAAGSTRHKIALSTAAQLGILAMVLLGTAQISTRISGTLSAQAIPVGIAMIGTVLGLHVTSLVLGWKLAARWKLPAPDAAAVAIAGSQKTLMVGLSLAMDLGSSILPLVTYHVAQLFVDTWIADRWLRPFVKQHADLETPREPEA